MRWLWLFLGFGALHAEIEQVRITWDKSQCDVTCVNLLEKNLNNFSPVAAYDLNPEKGIGYLRWMPTAPFNLIAVKRVYQSVGFGFGIGDVIVKVRGVLEKKGNAFIVRSLGDGTRFRLIGPPNPSTTTFHSTGSWQSYPLTPDQRSKLQEGFLGHQVVEVYGGIFFTEYDFPMIITQQIRFPDKLPNEMAK